MVTAATALKVASRLQRPGVVAGSETMANCAEARGDGVVVVATLAETPDLGKCGIVDIEGRAINDDVEAELPEALERAIASELVVPGCGEYPLSSTESGS